MKNGLPNHLSFHVKPKTSKFVSDEIIKGRRVVLRNIEITVQISSDERKPKFLPSIPAISGALDLLKKDVRLNDITWNSKRRKWTVSA